MSNPVRALPSLERLMTGLRSVLDTQLSSTWDCEVLQREANIYASTFPSEVVTCRWADGAVVQLFCKYSASRNRNTYGHRGGLVYEALVYERILPRVELSAPFYYGSYHCAGNDEQWLILQYLGHSCRLASSEDDTAVTKAAHWIGEFHSFWATRDATSSLGFLTRYDIEYFSGWSERAYKYSIEANLESSWLKQVCAHFPKWVEVLLDREQSVIHGEYYPKNILFGDDRVYPVDWESTALGPGEIDLATLTEGWPPYYVGRIESDYRQVRWGGVPPSDFSHALQVARIYLHLRWLGDRPEWTAEMTDRFDSLKRDAETLGML